MGDGRAVFEQLLREGAIVRPLDGFGAPEAIRITVGTAEEIAFFDALGQVFRHRNPGVLASFAPQSNPLPVPSIVTGLRRRPRSRPVCASCSYTRTPFSR